MTDPHRWTGFGEWGWFHAGLESALGLDKRSIKEHDERAVKKRQKITTDVVKVSQD
jgi:hypothetical protein